MLAIDTSTERAGIALGNGLGTSARSWDAGRTQTTSVLPAIDGLLRDAGIKLAELGAVAIAKGPGTFTGLRVGMSIAKGLVLARDIPIVGVPTLAIAAAAVEWDGELVVVLPAGRGRVVWQQFRSAVESQPRNTTMLELMNMLAERPDTLLVGELAEEHRSVIEGAHRNIRWQPRDPEVLLRLGRERWGRGEVDDSVTLEPSYLHGVTVSAGPVQDRLHKR